jgi:hypothetical protein
VISQTEYCLHTAYNDTSSVKNKQELASSNLTQGCAEYVERNGTATKAYTIWVRNVSKERGHLGNLTLKGTIFIHLMLQLQSTAVNNLLALQ